MRSGYGRARSLQAEIGKHGVAGVWTPGTYLGPGPAGTNKDARMSVLWGPDGIAISIANPNARASITTLTRGGRARRPMVMQIVNGSETGRESREIIRMELSDFLDMLAVYTQWLAQEGRLGQDE